VTLRALSLVNADVNILLRRHESEVAVTVLSRHGELRVLTIS
jgi:hypothetical protein